MKVCCLVVIVILVQLLQNVQLAAVKETTGPKGVENTSESTDNEYISEQDCNFAKKTKPLRQGGHDDIHIYVSHKPSKPAKLKNQLKIRIPLKKHHMRTNKKKTSKNKKHKGHVHKKKNSTNQTENEAPNNSSSTISPLISLLPLVPTVQNVAVKLSDSADGDDYNEANKQPQYDTQRDQTETPNYLSNNELYMAPVSRIINVTAPNQTMPVPHDIYFYQRQSNPIQQPAKEQAYSLETNSIPIPVQGNSVISSKTTMTSQNNRDAKQVQNQYDVVKNGNVVQYEGQSQIQENDSSQGSAAFPNIVGPFNNDMISKYTQYVNPQYIAIQKPYETQLITSINPTNKYPPPLNIAPPSYNQYISSPANGLLPNNQFYTQPNNGINNQLGVTQYPVNWGVPQVNGNPRYWSSPPQNGGPTWNGPCGIHPSNFCCPTNINTLPGSTAP